MRQNSIEHKKLILDKLQAEKEIGIHIGKLIQKRLKEEGRSIKWLAEKTCCCTSNIQKIFQKDHIHPVQLLHISQILNYDFFVHYSLMLKKDKKHCQTSNKNV